MNEIVRKENLFIMDEDGAMVVAPTAMEVIRDIEVQKKRIDKEYSAYKSALCEGMKEYGIKKAENENVVITYVDETERYSIDTKKLWDEYQDIAFKCEKCSPVSASVRIKTR